MRSSARKERRDQGKKHTTIIRRSIKKGHSTHHGGAWKVAFADFMLALMALFMVLWIVNSVSQKERKALISELHGKSVFTGDGISPLDTIGKKPVIEDPQSEEQDNVQRSGQDHVREESPDADKSRIDPVVKTDSPQQQKAQLAPTTLLNVKNPSTQELAALAKAINDIAAKSHMQSNLEMEIVPQGLRVLIKDDQNRSMFERGSAKITPFFRQLLVELTPVFDSVKNKIIITGHTDAMQYKKDVRYNNWSLSGDRALSARRVLEQSGMPEDKVMQVSAMSDRMLLNPQAPNSAENRRIEVMVLTKSASDTLYRYFGEQGQKVVAPAVKRVEKQQISPRLAQSH